MHFTLREKKHTIARRHLILVAITLFILMATGPFGTYFGLSFWERLGYWSTAIATVGTVSILTGLYFHHSPHFSKLHPLLVSLISATVATIPGTVFTIQLEAFWRKTPYENLPLEQVVSGVFVIILLATIVRYRTWDPNYMLARQPENPGQHPFFEHLPKNLHSELISLTMRDHYIECITTNGSKLLLMRFADALRELADYPGLQIHRSHWVAANTILMIKREGARYMATLTDGRKLPVSRTYLDAARQAIVSSADKNDPVSLAS